MLKHHATWLKASLPLAAVKRERYQSVSHRLNLIGSHGGKA